MFIGKIVLGSTVESAYYALVNDCVFVDTRLCPALFYKKTPVRILGHDRESIVWKKINTLLGLMSRRIHISNLDRVKIQEDRMRVVQGTSVFDYTFSKAVVFDATRLSIENEICVPNQKSYLVIDDFELSSLGPKRYELEELSQDTDFARELHFYSSNRVDGAKYITDCLLISELTQEQMNSFDYSDSIGKIFVERYLESIGVHGSFMNYNLNGTKKYRKPKVLHTARFVYEKDNNKYKDSEFVEFSDLTLEQIIEKSS